VPSTVHLSRALMITGLTGVICLIDDNPPPRLPAQSKTTACLCPFPSLTLRSRPLQPHARASPWNTAWAWIYPTGKCSSSARPPCRSSPSAAPFSRECCPGLVHELSLAALLSRYPHCRPRHGGQGVRPDRRATVPATSGIQNTSTRFMSREHCAPGAYHRLPSTGPGGVIRLDIPRSLSEKYV
jgi:hypothetical protein